MKRTTACIAISLVLAAASALAGVAGVAGDFEQANQRFAAGDFAVAAAAYENILGSEGPRASVYYNLGNAYQNLGQYGPAILAYERARQMTPRDPDLLANLARARKTAAAFEDGGSRRWFEPVAGFLSRNEWSWLVAGSVVFLGVLSVLRGAVRPAAGGLRKAVLVSFGVACVLIAVGAAALYIRRDEGCRGVVLTEKAAVHLSPFEASETLGTPGPGRMVLMRGRSGGFHYVEVPGANLRGWLPEREVAAITPESSGK